MIINYNKNYNFIIYYNFDYNKIYNYKFIIKNRNISSPLNL